MNVRYIAAAFVWVLGTGGGAAAQASPSIDSAPALEELDITVTASTDDRPAMILRRATGTPANVVLVNPYLADARQLSDAVRTLLLLQASDPAGARRNDRAAMSPAFTESFPAYPWAKAMLQRLRRSVERGGPGSTRSETIRLPLPRLVKRP